ncbi:MAG: metallophosphoesterase [Oscillospiraceae bacterium]|nr:metallophosphoesterase [Oscillospiraceae bacterium]
MKLIHCADLHLDSPLRTHMTKEQARLRNAELIHSFLRLTRYAREQQVRVVLIAGDLFDGERVKARTVDEVLEAIRDTPDTDYLYLPGNHDNATHAFSDHALPANLKRFPTRWETFDYGEVAISGIEMTGDNAEALYDSLPSVPDRLHIVTLHGQISTRCGIDQVNATLLRNRGIHYLALGHLHSYHLEQLDATGVYCYPGCLEGRGFDECGEKGFVLLETKHGRLDAQFVPFACRQLFRVPVDITGRSKNPEVLKEMEAQTAGIRGEDMVEFVLTGAGDPTSDLAIPYLEKMLRSRFFFSKIKDESRLALEPRDYKNDVSLKGAFIRQVLASELPEADKAAVIRVGIAALTGEDIPL